MSLRAILITMALAVASLCAAEAAYAQLVPAPPADPTVLAGPLTLAPLLQMNVGHDNNLFGRSEGDNPEGDLVASFSPSLDAWLTLAHARAAGRAKVDLYYYRDFVDLRAVDWSTEGTLGVPLNRFTPLVSGTFVSTTHDQSLETDAIAKQLTGTLRVGTEVRLIARTSLEVAFQRSRVDYDQETFYDDVDLSKQLDHVSQGGSVRVRYELTPLTRVGVGGDLIRDRFEFSPQKDTDNARVTASVELQPLALISGQASVGVQSRKSLSGTSPDFTGTVVNGDLRYTLLGQTRFTGSFSRRLDYSYIEGRTDYVEGTLRLTVEHQLNDSWDVGGNIGRSRLSYSDSIVQGSEVPCDVRG